MPRSPSFTTHTQTPTHNTKKVKKRECQDADEVGAAADVGLAAAGVADAEAAAEVVAGREG